MGAAVAGPLVRSAAGRAVACVCLPADAKQIVHGADAIIAGRIDSEMPLDATRTRSIVKVEGVYRGTVPATIFVDAALGTGGGSDCAVLYPVGAEVDPMVLVKLPGGSYTIEPCVLGSMPHVRALLGAARPPPPGGLPPVASGSSIPAPVATAAPTSGMSWGAVGLGLLLAVILIAAAVRSSARRAADHTSPSDDPSAEPTSPSDDPSAEPTSPSDDPSEPDRPGSDASG